MSPADLKLPRPHGNRILCFVAPTSGLTETQSGLHVVQSASEAPLIGHVLAVGQDVNPSRIEPHNQVMFSKYAGLVVDIGGRQYHVIEESDVLLVWPDLFDLPEALALPAQQQDPVDGPCVCHPLDETGPCGSSTCINREPSEPDTMLDQPVGSELVSA